MQQFDDKVPVPSSLVPLKEVIRGAQAKEDTLPEQMVCGFVQAINASEKVPAQLVDSLAALSRLPVEAVVFFEESDSGRRLQQLFFDENELVGVTPVVLKGYPGAHASAEFEQMAWNALSVSYDDLISDMVSTSRVDQMLKEEAGERQKRPPKEQLLTRDRVKHFDGFIDVVEDSDHDA